MANAGVPAGLQVCLWGYQSRTITLGEFADWIVIIGNSGGTVSTETNWLSPDVANTTQENLNLTRDMHNSTTAIVGRVDSRTGDI